jgi:tRNA threonylcarbamoyladenosine biosynthesis protein TsaE
MPMRTLVTRSADATSRAGESIAATLEAGDVVLLTGNLGLGKTVFARGVAVGLGVPPEEVHSPSFALVHQYRGRLPVYHIDLYRIEKDSDLDELGLEEILGGEGIALVEWAERLGPYRVGRCVEVTLLDRGGSAREVRIRDGRYSSR